MKSIKMLAVALGLVGFSAAAQAAGPVWVCDLHAVGSGKSWHVGLVGEANFKAHGTLSCVSPMGARQLPVSVNYQAWSPGLGYSETSHMEVLSFGLGLTAPEDIYGSFPAASAGVDVLLAGIHVDLVLQLGRGVGLNIGVRGVLAQGIGAAVDLGTLTISRAE